MIRRLKVRGYKSLRDISVDFERLSVLVGPNAAGKSNILDALQLVSRLATARSLKEAFSPPYRGSALESASFDEGGLLGLLQKPSVKFSIEIDIELSDQTVSAVEKSIEELRRGIGDSLSDRPRAHIKERFLRYAVEVQIIPSTGVVRISSERLAAIKPDGSEKARKPFLETEGKRITLRLEGQAHPTYHDVGLDHTIISRPLYPPHYPHIEAFRREIGGILCFYFEPRERMRAPNPIKEVAHIGIMGEDLAAFLNTLFVTEPKKFKAIERSIRLLIPRVSRIEIERTTLGEVELKLIEDGIPIPARLVSEGTLRFIGLLAVSVASDSPTTIALEEPENGIHPRRIQLLARFLMSAAQNRRLQLIVTTHSAVLPDEIPSGSIFLITRKGPATAVSRLDSVGPLFKRQSLQTALVDGSDPTSETFSDRMLRGDFDV